ncbi:MAG: ROK family protein [Anaerolineae bacterium]
MPGTLSSAPPALQAATLPLPARAGGLPKGRNITGVKAHNLRAVLLTLLRRGAVSRVDLAHLTGLSSTTITNLVAELLAEGVIIEAGKETVSLHREGTAKPNTGRPPRLLQLVPEARYAVGIHIGVDTLHVGVADLFGQLHSHLIVPHHEDQTPEQTLQRAADLVQQAVVKAGIGRPGTKLDHSCLVGVGVGASGLTDPKTGVNILAPNLGWREVPVRQILTERLGYPVAVDNNVRAMALAEAMFGAGREVHSLIFVYGRVGVGAGFVVNGELYHGSHAGAGEIGHTTIIPAGGAPCRCGNTGCLETLVAEAEIVRQATILAARNPGSTLAACLAQEEETPIDCVFAAAQAGDRAAQSLLSERAFYIGTALANLVNIVNPDMIIVGGVFAAGDGYLLPMIAETIRQRSFAGLGDRTVLRATTFGRRVGVVGAAALALDAFFYRPAADEDLVG